MTGAAETCMVHGDQAHWAALSTQMWGWLLAAPGEGSAWIFSSLCWASCVYVAQVPEVNARARAGQPVGKDGVQISAWGPFAGEGNWHTR